MSNNDAQVDLKEEQLVVFDLSGELFAISIERINTIIRMETITKVPGCEHFVEGVINLRGSILPVIDPRKKFGLPVKEPDRASRIVVVESASRMVGLIVDAVTETVRLSAKDIEPPSETIVSSSARYVRGIGKAGDKLLVLLDLDQLLDQGEMLDAAVLGASEPAAA
mgnify:FL=1